MKNKVTIHTGSSHAPNIGGISGISITISQKSDITEHSLALTETSANRLAIRAIIEGLKQLKKPSKVTVYSDSQ